MGCAESRTETSDTTRTLFTHAELLAKAGEGYDAAAKGAIYIPPKVDKMVDIIKEQVGGLNATTAYLKAHGGALPPDEANAVVEAVLEAVGSHVVSIWNLEGQIAGTTKQLGKGYGQGYIDVQLKPLWADHKKSSAQLERAVHLFSKVWKLTLPEKPAEADDLEAFAQLPLADAENKTTQIGVIGWLYLNDQTSGKAGGGGDGGSLAPYKADPKGEKVAGILTTFKGGVTAIISRNAAFAAAVSSFAAARTVLAEPLNLGVLQDIDHYEKVLKEALSASTIADATPAASAGGAAGKAGTKKKEKKKTGSASTGGSPVLDRLAAAVKEAKAKAPSEEHAAEVTVDPAAPTDPATLGYAMHIRRMAAPTALFLYLLASTLISTIPEAVGAVCVPGPIKGLIRMVAKVIDRYASFEPCRDVARCTVHFPTLDGMLAFLLALARSGLVYIIRVKNRFDEAYDALPAGGYRDLQLLLLLPDGGGTVEDGIRDKKVFRYVELQLNHVGMVEIKDGKSDLQKATLAGAGKAGKAEDALAGRAGHAIFNFARAIDAFSPRTLRYKGPPTDQICQAIKVGALLEVDFKNADLSSPEARAKLAVLGSKQCRVRTLHLIRCKLGPDGGKVLAKALETNGSLKELNLWDNKLDAEAGKAVAEALKVNTTLQSIGLFGNKLGGEGGKAVAEALKVNTTLQSIELGINDLGAEGGKAVAEMLKVNTTLQSIDLMDTDLGAEGGKAVAEALKVNTTLQSIKLNSNRLGAEAGKAVAEMLKVNTTLQSIDLRGNSLGAEGGKAVVEALKVNTTLQSIRLYGNSLDSKTEAAIKTAWGDRDADKLEL